MALLLLVLMVIFRETSYKKTKRNDEIYIKLSIEKQDYDNYFQSTYL